MKKNKHVQATLKTAPKAAPKSVKEYGIIGLFFIVLYLIVDNLPVFAVNDQMAIQWLFIACVNILVSAHVIYNYEAYKPAIVAVASRTVTLVYLALILVAAISISYAINPVEAWIVLTRVLTTFICFFNVSILLINRSKYFVYIAGLVSLSLLVISTRTIYDFFVSLNAYELKGNTGNKNILAASIIVSTPFVLYCIHVFSDWKKWVAVVVLTIVIFALILINARASFLSMILEGFLYAGFSLAVSLKQKDLKSGFKTAGFVLVPMIIAILASQFLFSQVNKTGNRTGGYGAITQRLSAESLSSETNSLRLTLYQHAIDYIGKHPIAGAGLGNWKIADMMYAYDVDFIFAKHAHDDFLEITAETGLPGGILFLAIFVILLLNTIKVLRSDAANQTKIICLVSFFMLGAYAVDALFNFPSERPIMQVYFALILAINVFSVAPEIKDAANNSVSRNGRLLMYAIILVSVIVVYYANLNYKSSKIQFVSNKDVLIVNPQAPFVVGKDYPEIPNLTDNNFPVDVIRAFDAYHEGRNAEALTYLNASTKINPYSMANEYVKGLVFNSMNQLDSATYYAEYGLKRRPKNFHLFKLITEINTKTKDTAAIERNFKVVMNATSSVMFLDQYLFTLIQMQAPDAQLYRAVDLALSKYPDDPKIKSKRIYVAAFAAFRKGDFPNALINFQKLIEVDRNPAYVTYTGIVEYQLKNYPAAMTYFDEVIAANSTKDGKAEYFKAYCLIQLGRKEEGCSFLREAGKRNYPGAKEAALQICGPERQIKLQ